MNKDIIWLAFEKHPHPDAVIHPANVADAELALELIARPQRQRQQIVCQLQNYLAEQSKISVFERTQVPVRRTSGLYLFISWRFAKWLSHILPATHSQLEQTSTRIRNWLEEVSSQSAVTVTR